MKTNPLAVTIEPPRWVRRSILKIFKRPGEFPDPFHASSADAATCVFREHAPNSEERWHSLPTSASDSRSEEHTSELQSHSDLVDQHSFPTRRSSDLDENQSAGCDNRAAKVGAPFHLKDIQAPRGVSRSVSCEFR